MRDVAKCFPVDVAGHVMTVKYDDGVHRCVRFGKPDSSDMSFTLTTWPGYLCFSGDMGTYVFQRLDDMFRFFRGHRPNLHYWAEKVEAIDRNGAIDKFDADVFREEARRILDELDLSENKRIGADHDLAGFDGGIQEARDLLEEWGVSDAWEYNFTEYTFRFQWCCHAIPWAIGIYDAAKANTEGGTP